MNVGFIGLGIMGLPMAGHLAKGGHTVHAHDHKPVPRSLLDAGAVACASAREVAERADVVITMVPDTPNVASALFDAGGVDPGFRIALHQKDLGLALGNARQIGLSLPNTATAQELFSACAAHGGKAWDHSALVRALELLADHELGAQTDRK
jgi:3-hydroxyisobutyrate dehydrogenase-like beta-hydroxyacid dehydrogenase